MRFLGVLHMVLELRYNTRPVAAQNNSAIIKKKDF